MPRTPRLLPLVIGTFAVGTDAFVMAGVLPDIAADLHVSQTAAGQLVTLFAIAYAVGPRCCRRCRPGCRAAALCCWA